MKNKKWLIIVIIIISILFLFRIGNVFLLNILLFIWIFGTLFFPYILGIVISVIIIFFVRKRLTDKYKKYDMLIYTVITILCIFVFSHIGYKIMLYLSEKPDKVYTEMKELNDSNELIGLSKDEVLQLLGVPSDSTDDMLIYDAGKVTNYLFFGEREFYDLFIWFDENDKVSSTSIDLPRGG